MKQISRPDALLDSVVAAMECTPDARLREVMKSLVRHLHLFVRETKLTEAEFECALEFVVSIGKATGDTKNEVVLCADLLGISSLVALQNNSRPDEDCDSALLGPFWRAEAPLCAAGQSIARGDTAGVPLAVRGVVRNDKGEPLSGAIVDVWQASPIGLYENQDTHQPDMNLRGRFTTDEQGGYLLRSVVPAGYPVPTDGPCGDLLRAQQRHPNRPAHLHFMVSKPGYRVLVTQVFTDDDENLGSDPVFGVAQPLIGRFERSPDARSATLAHDFVLHRGETVFPRAPIP